MPTFVATTLKHFGLQYIYSIEGESPWNNLMYEWCHSYITQISQEHQCTCCKWHYLNIHCTPMKCHETLGVQWNGACKFEVVYCYWTLNIPSYYVKHVCINKIVINNTIKYMNTGGLTLSGVKASAGLVLRNSKTYVWCILDMWQPFFLNTWKMSSVQAAGCIHEFTV